MPRMLKELSRDGDSGLLGIRGRGGGPRMYGVAQYWESREKLLAYASDQSGQHRPAWAAFGRRVRAGGSAHRYAGCNCSITVMSTVSSSPSA